MRWALEIAQALHYLHSFKPMVVHRDLKLENILLTSPDPARAHAKLADFGLHKMIKVILVEFYEWQLKRYLNKESSLSLLTCSLLCAARPCSRLA